MGCSSCFRGSPNANRSWAASFPAANRRCCRSRPLLLNPRIMLLDEPSQGLAPLIVREVMQVVRRMREEGLSVLLIEQNAPLSLSIADRAYILDDGKVVYSGSAAELAKDTELVNKLAGAGHKAAKAS